MSRLGVGVCLTRPRGHRYDVGGDSDSGGYDLTPRHDAVNASSTLSGTTRDQHSSDGKTYKPKRWCASCAVIPRPVIYASAASFTDGPFSLMP